LQISFKMGIEISYWNGGTALNRLTND